MTLPSVYISYPRVLLANQEDSDLTASLVLFVVEETCAGLYRAEVTFNNFGANGSRMGYLSLGVTNWILAQTSPSKQDQRISKYSRAASRRWKPAILMVGGH